MAHDSQAGTREQWGSQFGFLMAAIGSAVGLGNIWRFPGIAYENGGGAFMIPYIVALLLVGIPVLLLDYSLGHRMRGSAPAIFRRISPKLEWLGWWQVAICFFIMTYYGVIIAWSMRYVGYSLNVAWKNADGGASGFFYGKFIEVSETASYSAHPVWNVAVPLLIVWAVVLFFTAKGVRKGVELLNRVCIPLLLVLFLALVVRALLRPGAVEGLNALWTPDFSALSKPSVWVAAMAQIFFSLSVGFGIMMTYSSYLDRKSNLVGTGMVAAFANSSFEILAGFGVFATLGFMAHQQGVGVAELDGLTGISLSFVTFPTVIAQMPGGPIFGVLFFLSLTLAGLTSMISIIQVVASSVGEKLGMDTRKSALVVGIPSAFLSVLIFATKSGIFSLDVVDAYVNQIAVVSSAAIMCVVVAFVARQLPALQRHLNVVSGTPMIGSWWRVLVGAAVPAFLVYLFVDTAVGFLRDQYDQSYSRGFENVFGWGMIAVAVAITVTLTLVRWRTPVDEFTPTELDDPAKLRRRRPIPQEQTMRKESAR